VLNQAQAVSGDLVFVGYGYPDGQGKYGKQDQALAATAHG
jgi:hypothetical protein